MGFSKKWEKERILSMQTIEIKSLTEADLKELQQISKQTFWDTFAEFNTPENMDTFLNEAYSTEQLLTELKSNDSQFYFLKIDGKTAAYSKENFDENGFELERIYVLKDFQKYGLGKLLLDHAISAAKLAQVQEIKLGVWEHNENAKAFYKKQGFKRQSQHVFQLGDDPQTDFILTKQL
ncbi:GNAT family N-acetyltransferase [Companilactobacillus zhongbaensis]|uniref:GNAT family N-acetyltransferase n=1 Tax=Companilactobacillus zhongbaensis TaxID=2486009 RepID=UPI002989A874|nr:GNAT family N-acetyltransferase [Companilactobacillus zhongbaensis]